ncbi:EAL and HDOD domain-containing protein [Pseudodesulfovibrio tunisiensis]|uniref:EAL and HDOD domain-containing protein n=1 Tax=Pseudodesulfovibrio tunisiensis TaxID=463192 RepID=UPI001FB263C5|nr:HDOD domain-containing protein [Pseudodesulfovibrio tunisiensis]
MNTEKTYESIFVARQPVFDRHRDTWGYLMLFRDSQDADRAIFTDDSEATRNLVANLPLCSEASLGKARIMIHFTPEDVLDGIPLAVPWNNTVVIVEEEPGSTAYYKALADLRREGYLVALNNYTGREDAREIMQFADLLMVDICGRSDRELTEIVDRAKQAGAPRLMAKRVESNEEFKRAKSLGFDLFHGFFFRKPQTQSGRKITSSEITRLKLFEIIEKEEPDFDALTPAIEADVSVSYRLLNFLNSATFSFSTTITSIRQAVVLAGWRPIRNWLRLLILTDLAPSRKSQELSYLSAHRAKLFETAALGGGHEKSSDKLFMLGLFSLLDAMLDMDMAAVVKHLPVDDAIKSALCGEPGEYEPWLRLALSIESSDWDAVGDTARELGLLPGTVAVSYQHAFSWADSFFGGDANDGPIQ